MLLMLVTILVSPYGFFTDEIVLLPSIIFAFSFTAKRKYSGWILFAINTAALIIAMALGAQLSSPAYTWTPVAWLAWFLYSTGGFQRKLLSKSPTDHAKMAGDQELTLLVTHNMNQVR